MLSVDVGGTFTDVTLAHRSSGRIFSVKVSSTADDPSLGFGEGIRQALEVGGISADAITGARHATTIATNAILEGRGARCAIVCSQGFRHVLEIGRHDGPRRTSLHSWIKPVRPVPPDRIFEVAERIAHDGSVELEPDDADIDRAVERLRSVGAQSVAVCLINAYANDTHERRVRDRLRDALPGVAISISTDVLPVFREYERMVATVLNASVLPLVGQYLARLRGRLADIGIEARLLVMQSNGGLDSPDSIQTRPAWTVLSGPAAGVIGAVDIAGAAGFTDIISLDVGGTSSDVALVQGGQPELTDEGTVGPWPLALPMVDVHTIGAGGGSIARAEGGNLSVGPASAGSRPGPACYGAGGQEATVTDALLTLGRIPDALAGGTVRLDPDAAARAVQRRVGDALDLDLLQAAWGIVEVAEHNIAAAVRLISTERGLDPREHVLVAGGGAGPLHAASVARLLGISTILIPTAPGVLSTIGLLVADLRREFTTTSPRSLTDEPPATIERVFHDLEAEANRWFEAEGIARSRRRTSRHLSLRYPEQPSELTVPWPRGSAIGAKLIESLTAAFHRRHRERYGYDLPDRPVEMVSARLEAFEGRANQPGARPPARARRRRRDRSRPVYLAPRDGLVQVPVVDRWALGPRSRVDGPAVIEQADATTYVPPGWVARPDPYGNLLVAMGSQP